jgi:large subunit ribosomal protein L18
MNKLQKKAANQRRRQNRVRGKVNGTAARPRLSVTRSNANVYVQVVDDVAHKTLIGVSTLGPEFKATGEKAGTVAGAKAVGEIVGKKALEAGIDTVVFDRGGHIYHGRVAAVAEGAREAGLKF